MNYKRNVFLLILLISFLILPWSCQIKPQSTLLSNTHPELKILNGLTLSINGNLALGAAASSGNGSAELPYIIKNKIINASGAGTHGISIRNTNVYFVLRNCTVTNAYTPYIAVYLYNVTHARLENINASNNHGVAIYINGSALITLNGTIANNNYYTGVALWKSLSINLTDITVNSNSYGFELEYTNYTTINGIIANNNAQTGIYYMYSINTTLTGATASNNAYGIAFRSCNNSKIVGNTADNNKYDGIRLILSDNNRVSGNYASGNAIGIFLASSNYNLVQGNTLYGNSECITEDSEYICVGNTFKNNNCGTSMLLILLIILIPLIGVAIGLFILYQRRHINIS